MGFIEEIKTRLGRQGLREILASDRARRIRDGFSRQQVIEDLCRRCTYRQRFSSQAIFE